MFAFSIFLVAADLVRSQFWGSLTYSFFCGGPKSCEVPILDSLIFFGPESCGVPVLESLTLILFGGPKSCEVPILDSLIFFGPESCGVPVLESLTLILFGGPKSCEVPILDSLIFFGSRILWGPSLGVPYPNSFWWPQIWCGSSFGLPYPYFSERVAVGGWIWCQNLLKTLLFTVFSSNRGSKTVIFDQKSFHHDATRLKNTDIYSDQCIPHHASFPQ